MLRLFQDSIRCLTQYRQPRLRRRQDLCCPNSGQSLLEVAFMLPFLLLLLLGVIEIGRYAYIGILVGNAARAGAAFGIQSRNLSMDPGVITAAKNDFQSNGLDPALLTVDDPVDTCTCDNGGTFNPATPTASYCNAPPQGTNNTAGTCSTGHWVVLLTVTAHGTFSGLFNYPGIPSSITISRSATMRVNLLD